MNRRNKLLLAIVVCGLVLTGSGLVIGLEGNTELLKGPLGDQIDRATSLVEQHVPWADSMNLEVREVEGGAGDKHVVAEGVIQGDDGQQMDVFIDVDYAENMESGMIAIGPEGSVQVFRDGEEQEGTLVTDVESDITGGLNATDITTLWRDGARVTGTTSMQAGNTTITRSFEAEGSGKYEQTTDSSGHIRIESRLEVTP